MSELVLDRGVGADLLPAYLGETAAGESTSGGDMERLERRARLAIRTVRETRFVQEFETPPQSSEAIKGFSDLVDRLQLLRREPESDDFGPVRPSQPSVRKAIGVLFRLAQRGFLIPPAVDVGTDHDGGIRLVWENGPRFLELVIPYERDAAAYFYHSDGDHPNLQYDLTATALWRRFNWLRNL